MEAVYEYTGAISTWIVLKKEILRTLPPYFRTLFSTRDPMTKKQRINEFERKLAATWSELAGCDVVFTVDDEAQR
jgi:hypothetical protein